MHISFRFLKPRRKSETLGLIFLGIMAIVVLRLFFIQIIQHSYYTQKAYQQQVAKFILPATRGEIYAKQGNSIVPLVLNQPVYLAYADPQQVGDKAKLEKIIQTIASGNVVDGYQDSLKSTRLRYVVLARDLSYDQATALKKQNLPGVGLTQTDQRVYPEGDLASQVLGYVNNDAQGQYGVEQALNSRLKGVDGKLQTVTDVRRIPLTVGKDDISVPARNGQNLALSIDVNVQAYVEAALKRGLDNVHATIGNAIVMNPNNGQIIAMANDPTYDPSNYDKVTDYSVFQNGVASAPYEAGSVMKTLTIASGLDAGAITPSTTYTNLGYVDVDGIRMNNVEGDPTSTHTTMTNILQYSLNTGAVFVLQQLGGGQVNLQARNKLYDYFTNHYGFGKTTGVELADESPGLIIPPTAVQGNNVRYANMAFGQGFEVTMLQMAAAFSAAVNGGIYYQPTVLAGTTNDGQNVQTQAAKVVRKNVVQPNVSAELRTMIVQARQLSALGGKDQAGYIVGGKTGTSQTVDPATGAYTNNNAVGSYLGFGGNQTPQYVIMIQVKNSQAPGYAGSVAAAPIFTDISNWLINYLKIPPVS